MSKKSVITIRETPVASTAGAAGALIIRSQTFEMSTSERIELIDLTDEVMACVRGSAVKEGLVSLWSMHTTFSLFINESQQALHADIKTFLEDLVARDKYYMHNDPNHSDCDRRNADAHLRAMMLGHSLTLQVTGGEVVLGQWQRIMGGELDGPRTRRVRAQVQGLG